MTDRQLTDLMRAVDDLEVIKRKVFDAFEPLWDADEHMFIRALAVLHELIRQANQPTPYQRLPDDWGALRNQGRKP